MTDLHQDYPWLTPNAPIVVSAPMMKITMAKLALSVSAAGGFGFLAAGFDLTPLGNDIAEAAALHSSIPVPNAPTDVLPIGIGFQNWGSDVNLAVEALSKHPVAAVWFFAPNQLSDLMPWTKKVREMSQNRTKVWIQVGTVSEALEVAKTSKPDVLVIQGADSGGHGLAQRAGIVTLLPEVADALAANGISIPLIAAGGIMDGRGAAAAVALGAAGVCLGTRFLASHEAIIAKGYQDEVLRVTDGGVSTVNSKVYDVVRGIKGWPIAYNGRGVANMSYLDALGGMDDSANQALYKKEMQKGDLGWGPQGRMTTYAGTGVGLVKKVQSSKEIVEETRTNAVEILKKAASRWS